MEIIKKNNKRLCKNIIFYKNIFFKKKMETLFIFNLVNKYIDKIYIVFF